MTTFDHKRMCIGIFISMVCIIITSSGAEYNVSFDVEVSNNRVKFTSDVKKYLSTFQYYIIEYKFINNTGLKVTTEKRVTEHDQYLNNILPDVHYDICVILVYYQSKTPYRSDANCKKFHILSIKRSSGSSTTPDYTVLLASISCAVVLVIIVAAVVYWCRVRARQHQPPEAMQPRAFGVSTAFHRPPPDVGNAARSSSDYAQYATTPGAINPEQSFTDTRQSLPPTNTIDKYAYDNHTIDDKVYEYEQIGSIYDKVADRPLPATPSATGYNNAPSAEPHYNELSTALAGATGTVAPQPFIVIGAAPAEAQKKDKGAPGNRNNDSNAARKPPTSNSYTMDEPGSRFNRAYNPDGHMYGDFSGAGERPKSDGTANGKKEFHMGHF